MPKKFGTNKEARHVRHYEWELASPAYRSLDCVARCMLQELKRLFKGQAANNNGDLFMSARHGAELLNVNKDTALRALRMLEERGFIRPKVKGHFDWKVSYEKGKMTGRATTWILTEYGYANRPPTKDFMHWRAAENLETRSENRDATVPKTGHPVPQAGQLAPDCPPIPDSFAENPPSTVPLNRHIHYAMMETVSSAPALGDGMCGRDPKLARIPKSAASKKLASAHSSKSARASKKMST